MASNISTTLIASIFTDTRIFGMSWLLAAIIGFLTLPLLTRNTEKWKTLAFPVFLGWSSVGLVNSQIVLYILALVYLINTISLEVIGSIATAIPNSINKATARLQEKYRWNINAQSVPNIMPNSKRTLQGLEPVDSILGKINKKIGKFTKSNKERTDYEGLDEEDKIIQVLQGKIMPKEHTFTKVSKQRKNVHPTMKKEKGWLEEEKL